MKKNPFCPQCEKEAVLTTYEGPCQYCEDGTARSDYWEPTCKCKAGVQMPDISATIEHYDTESSPLNVLAKKLSRTT